MNFKIGEEVRVRLWRDIIKEFIVKGRTVYATPIEGQNDLPGGRFTQTIETPNGVIDNAQIIKSNCCGEFATVVSVDENEIKILFGKEEINTVVETNQIKFNKYILIKKNQLKKIKEMKKKDKKEIESLEW